MPLPYANHVGDSDPVELLNTTLEEYRDAAALLAGASWNQPWALGKWTLREIMVHVAQWEMILGYRLAAAVVTPGFVIQVVDQDALLRRTGGVDGPTAFAAFEGARRYNYRLAQVLNKDDRAVEVTHPEYGRITVNDIVVQIAGHGIHHLKQIRAALGPRTEAAV